MAKRIKKDLDIEQFKKDIEDAVKEEIKEWRTPDYDSTWAHVRAAIKVIANHAECHQCNWFYDGQDEPYECMELDQYWFSRISNSKLQ